ncbi:putative RDD family membrane protein YckC [Mycolicibacterium sp. BK634]|uniref:RDD family protein n=1 Tax=Mycobacteriaceae TaxID=1762 RepID=UPI0010D80CA7|nr:RDD family protein [Mycobacterium sp. BK086]MBB3749060.1 putative RDD family membrane protein YckC [Mycolicibacterium sp. BK634]TDO14729.1 RDD family protein [Mycobacterium sp. BK086]
MTNAGIVSRGLAAVVDMIVVLVTMGASYLGLALTTLILNPAAFRFPAPNLIFSTTVTLAVSVLYLTGCWTLSGRTLGAALLGVRVVDRRGKPMRMVIAILRAVACVLFPVGLLWVAVDRQRRSAQDIVLGSRVIYDRPAPGASVR